jgi:hypothetical protein
MGALVLMRRGLSRRRLATGTPADRVAGAWLEVRDALRLAGVPAANHLSATELASQAAAALLGDTGRGRLDAAGGGDGGRGRLRPAVEPPAGGRPAGSGGENAAAGTTGQNVTGRGTTGHGAADPGAAGADRGTAGHGAANLGAAGADRGTAGHGGTAGQGVPDRGTGGWSAGESATAAAPSTASGDRAGGDGSSAQNPTVPELATLVDLVNRDAFAPATTSDAEATEAGSAARAYTSRLRATQSRWRRLAWPFHPGPLRWQRTNHDDPR